MSTDWSIRQWPTGPLPPPTSLGPLQIYVPDESHPSGNAGKRVADPNPQLRRIPYPGKAGFNNATKRAQFFSPKNRIMKERKEAMAAGEAMLFRPQNVHLSDAKFKWARGPALIKALLLNLIAAHVESFLVRLPPPSYPHPQTVLIYTIPSHLTPAQILPWMNDELTDEELPYSRRPLSGFLDEVLIPTLKGAPQSSSGPLHTSMAPTGPRNTTLDHTTPPSAPLHVLLQAKKMEVRMRAAPARSTNPNSFSTPIPPLLTSTSRT